jgi:hypothetical protein
VQSNICCAQSTRPRGHILDPLSERRVVWTAQHTRTHTVTRDSAATHLRRSWLGWQGWQGLGEPGRRVFGRVAKLSLQAPLTHNTQPLTPKHTCVPKGPLTCCSAAVQYGRACNRATSTCGHTRSSSAQRRTRVRHGHVTKKLRPGTGLKV